MVKNIAWQIMTLFTSHFSTTIDRHTWAAGALSMLAYVYLAANSQEYGQLQLNQLLTATFLCALLSFWIWHLHQRAGSEIKISTLLGFAIVFRLIGLTTFPILEDDIYRYLWDAHMTWQNGSPYGVAPAEFFGDETLSGKLDDILSGINYPYVATIYGPTCQWLFALAYLIAPGEIWPLQLLLAIADIALIWVLLKLAKPNAVLLYAWCPLVIKEFAITAHPDVLGALLLVLALLCHRRKLAMLVGACLALAVGVKIFALLLVPFLLMFNWRAWLGFALTATLIALPFGLQNAWIPSGLSAMSSDWLFNAPLYSLLNHWWPINTIKISLLTALALICAWHWFSAFAKRAEFDPVKDLRGDFLFAALFLCAPAFNAWYLVWLLPFAVLRPSLWAWLASVTLLLSYASGINLPDTLPGFLATPLANATGSPGLQPYQHPNWVLITEFIPPLLAALVSFAYWLRQWRLRAF